MLQVILRPGAVPLPLDEQDVPIFTSDDEFITFFNANNAQDIAEEITADITIPLFRINLYISGGTKYMVVSINHVAYDGISIPVMLRNLASHYERRCVEHPSPSLQSINYDPSLLAASHFIPAHPSPQGENICRATCPLVTYLSAVNHLGFPSMPSARPRTE